MSNAGHGPGFDDAPIPASAVRDLVRRLHTTASQEAAAARIAIAVWRRAADKGDSATAVLAVGEAEARLEALFDALAALESSGKALLATVSEVAPPA